MDSGKQSTVMLCACDYYDYFHCLSLSSLSLLEAITDRCTLDYHPWQRRHCPAVLLSCFRISLEDIRPCQPS